MAVLSERFAPICTRTLLRCVEAAAAAACFCSPACLLRAGDSYAPPAGAPLFAPPAGGGIWAAAHQRTLLSSFVLLLFLKDFLLYFLQIF
jgi:hypothetical protein